MKKALWIGGAILLAALLAGGGFWAGMSYQNNKTEQARTSFFNARGQGNGGQFPGSPSTLPGGIAPGGQQNGQGGAQGGFFTGRGTVGEVKSVEGDTLTLSTAQDVTTVTLNDATEVQKTVTGGLEDLAPGTRVMVTGERDSSGHLTATRIQIMDDRAFPLGPGSAATGTAP